MPFNGFENFDACCLAMQKDGKSAEEAKAICGKMQADAERMNSNSKKEELRELRFEFSSSKLHDLNGGLLVKDVRLLANGTWTDSHIGTPLFYPEKTLEKFAGNWIDRSLWSRHSGGMPRSITDKIGEIQGPRYNSGAVMGDLFMHGKTQASRDTMELVKAGLVNYVSVEHGGKERWNSAQSRYESEELIFSGVAVVNKGACAVCTIQNESPEEPVKTLQSQAKEAETMETDVKKLEAELAERQAASGEKKDDIKALESQLKNVADGRISQTLAENEDLKKKISELEASIEKQNKQLAEKEQGDRIKELQRQIEALSKQPDYRTYSAAPQNVSIGRDRTSELDSEAYPAYTIREFGE